MNSLHPDTQNLYEYICNKYVYLHYPADYKYYRMCKRRIVYLISCVCRDARCELHIASLCVYNLVKSFCQGYWEIYSLSIMKVVKIRWMTSHENDTFGLIYEGCNIRISKFSVFFSSCDQPAHDAQAWSLIETNDNTYWAIVKFCALNT